MRELLSSLHPIRSILDLCRADRRAAANASSPQPGGPAILRRTSGRESAVRSKAATRSGRPLRGSTLPMARMYGGSDSPRDRGGGSGVSPLWMTCTRSPSTWKWSMTSSAMDWDTVWMEAPSATARRMRPGYRSDVGLHNSGKRTGVRSCTVTSRAALREGGTTKFVPCTTSTGPVHRSIAGWSKRAQVRSNASAGIGIRRAARTEPGSCSGRAFPAVALSPYPMTSRSGSVETAEMKPLTDSPTPVRTPSRGVASIATATERTGPGMHRTLESDGRRPRCRSTGSYGIDRRSRSDACRW